MRGGFYSEVEPQRDLAGNGPVVHYEIQEDRGLDHDGNRQWYIWTEVEGIEDAKDSYRTVKAFGGERDIRLAKVSVEVVEVPE